MSLSGRRRTSPARKVGRRRGHRMRVMLAGVGGAAVPVKQLGAPLFWVARTSFNEPLSAAKAAVTRAALALEAQPTDPGGRGGGLRASLS